MNKIKVEINTIKHENKNVNKSSSKIDDEIK